MEKQKCTSLHPLQRIDQEPYQLKRNVESSEETKQKENFSLKNIRKTFQDFLVFWLFFFWLFFGGGGGFFFSDQTLGQNVDSQAAQTEQREKKKGMKRRERVLCMWHEVEEESR